MSGRSTVESTRDDGVRRRRFSRAMAMLLAVAGRAQPLHIQPVLRSVALVMVGVYVLFGSALRTRTPLQLPSGHSVANRTPGSDLGGVLRVFPHSSRSLGVLVSPLRPRLAHVRAAAVAAPRLELPAAPEFIDGPSHAAPWADPKPSGVQLPLLLGLRRHPPLAWLADVGEPVGACPAYVVLREGQILATLGARLRGGYRSAIHRNITPVGRRPGRVAASRGAFAAGSVT